MNETETCWLTLPILLVLEDILCQIKYIVVSRSLWVLCPGCLLQYFNLFCWILWTVYSGLKWHLEPHLRAHSKSWMGFSFFWYFRRCTQVEVVVCAHLSFRPMQKQLQSLPSQSAHMKRIQSLTLRKQKFTGVHAEDQSAQSGVTPPASQLRPAFHVV